MLARPADDLDDAMSRLADPYLEFKLDGARVQVHKKGSEVRVFSRQGNDVTTSVPELVEIASAVAAEDLVLDGETLVLREDGRPQPFQTTMRRFGRRRDVEALGRELPLTAFFFDCIYRDGQLLIDAPASMRYEALADALAGDHLIQRRRARGKRAAMDFLNQALALGHEGLMEKTPPPPIRPEAVAAIGSKSSRSSRSTWSFWPPSGAAAGAGAGFPICTWARAIPTAGSSCWARPSRA
jgi:DNA ligase-1